MMKRLLLFTLVLACLLASLSLRAQIVNVESKRIQTDSLGWSGTIEGDFNLTKNTTRIFAANGDAAVQWKRKKDLYLLLGDYGFLKGDTQKFIDNTFVHLRYDRSLNRWLQAESFVQYQNNKITRIARRFLAGTGPRFRLPSPHRWQAHLGVVFMYEYEEEVSKPVIYERTVRNSDYLSLLWKPSASLSLSSTTFYQPRLSRFADFRILNDETVTVGFTKHLSLTVSWDYLYDAFPVTGVPRSNYTLETGIKYLFTP
jgi:hypothetical protein